MVTKRTKQGLSTAAFAAAAAGAAASYYFYASKDAKKNRKIAAKWARDLKGDIVRTAKKLEGMDRAQVVAIIDMASKAYKTVRSVDRHELDRAISELKKNWRELAREAGTRSIAKRRVKKTSRTRTKQKAR
ncbi:MAG TPA: hypothetical protein VJH91_02405 [Candidatus Paceibacterota bacterium]